MVIQQGAQTVVGMVDTKEVKETASTVCGSVLKWCGASWKPVLAELVSTSILILLGCMSCIPIAGLPYEQPLYTPLTFGFVVMLNIQIFGHLSGAHMNPAVTFAAIVWGSMRIPLGIAYAIAQCCGAILGYGILISLSPVDMVGEGLCTTTPQASLDVLQVLGIEIALSTVLNFINCSVWDPINQSKLDSVPVKFGLAIAGLSFAGGPLTGASMNPARTLGPAVWTGMWTTHWVYWVGPFIGGGLAALLYRLVWLQKHEPKTDDN